MNDTHYSYQAWADASVFPKRAVIALEREMLGVLRWNLSVRSHDITSHYSALMSRCQPRRVAAPPAVPLLSLHSLDQACEQYPSSHWSPAGSSDGSSSSASPYDSPTLLTPGSQLFDGSECQWVPHAQPSDHAPYAPEEFKPPPLWPSLSGARPACMPAPAHDPAFPQSPGSPHQRIFGDAPGVHAYARGAACRTCAAHSITLPHLSEVLPPSLVLPPPIPQLQIQLPGSGLPPLPLSQIYMLASAATAAAGQIQMKAAALAHQHVASSIPQPVHELQYPW